MGTKSKSDKAKETTLLVLVVDRSGSMQSIKEDMEGGIASLLAEQGKEKGQCLVTLAQFDTEYDLVADGVPVAELEPYRLVPRGGTALLDAIGRTIAHVKDQVDQTRQQGWSRPRDRGGRDRRPRELQQGVEPPAGHGLGEGPGGRGLGLHLPRRQSGCHRRGWPHRRGCGVVAHLRRLARKGPGRPSPSCRAR